MYVSTLVVTVLLLSCAFAAPPFQAHLKAPHRAELGSDVICEVTITNTDSEDYILFLQGTPLQKIPPNIFKVTHGEDKLNYDGPFFKKRAVNSHSKGVTLKSQQSITASVELSSVYSMSKQGDYTVSLRSKVYFMKDGDHTVSHIDLQSHPVTFTMHSGKSESGRMTMGEKHRAQRRQTRNETVNTRSSGLIPATITNGPSGTATINDIRAAQLGWTNAYNIIKEADATKESTSKSLYVYWFGLSPSDVPEPWDAVLSDMQEAMESATFTLEIYGSFCEEGVYAYTYHGGDTIYMCDAYISAKDTGYDSKMGITVHELSHAVGKTEDWIYGQYYCRLIAQYYTDFAIENADNYEYFTEQLEQQ